MSGVPTHPAPPVNGNSALLVLLATEDQASTRLRELYGALTATGITAYLVEGADDTVLGRLACSGSCPHPATSEVVGAAFPDPPVRPVLSARPATAVALSPRERQILELVAAGHSNRLISRRLFISEATVKKHLTRIFSRFGVDNRTAAAAMARRLGCISA